MSQERQCPKCGAALTPDAPQGICPQCLMKLGMESQAQSGPRPSDAPTTPHTTRFVPPEPQELSRFFPQFEILELIGHGGMGAVYKARQPALDRVVALKILPTEAAADPAFAERFGREARAMARLHHPNIVMVYDFGSVEGLYYLVMEYVDGVNLRQTLSARQLPPEQALAIVPQVCEALQYAHEEGIVHRDIKPENILLDRRGKVKIADFGLAKLLGRERNDFTLTGTQQVMGTPHYMAPEQIERPQQVDHRADIYSLGVVFYEMLTGELPIGKFGPPSAKVQMDVRLDEVVLRSLEKEPERRFQHASEVKTHVETISNGPRTAQPVPAAMFSGQSGLTAGAFPMAVLMAFGFIFGGLCIAAGVVLLVVAFLQGSENPNSFWGWMGAAIGCLMGGAGAVGGTWNTYRQLEGAGDLMQEPHWNWLDTGIAAYGLAGLVALLVGLGGSNWFSGTTTYALSLLGGLIVAQAALFMFVRILLRRSAQQREAARLVKF